MTALNFFTGSEQFRKSWHKIEKDVPSRGNPW